MALKSSPTEQLASNLEDLLVQEFRLLQSLITVTREERLKFTGRDMETLMTTVEQKEVVLDQLSLIEDSRRMVAEQLATALGQHPASLAELIPFLDTETGLRLSRLSEGIAALVSQARDLNYGNRVLTRTALDWTQATQAFLLSCYQPQPGYRPPGAAPTFEQTAVWDTEHRA